MSTLQRPAARQGWSLYRILSIFSQQFAHKQRFGRVVTPFLMLLLSISRIVLSFSEILQENPKTDGAFASPLFLFLVYLDLVFLQAPDGEQSTGLSGEKCRNNDIGEDEKP